jgi:hypothetical protein
VLRALKRRGFSPIPATGKAFPVGGSSRSLWPLIFFLPLTTSRIRDLLESNPACGTHKATVWIRC